jgi:Protein of unknown function (DUF2924)
VELPDRATRRPAYGGLSKASQRELNRLISELIVKPEARLTVARRAKSGTVLVRDWKGSNHRVMITEDGFFYNDQTFSNLSEIARLITGTRWNGPRFFGLRRHKGDDATAGVRGRHAKPPGIGRPQNSNATMAAKRKRAGNGL